MGVSLEHLNSTQEMRLFSKLILWTTGPLKSLNGKITLVDRFEFPVKPKLFFLFSSSRHCHILNKLCIIFVIYNQIKNLIFWCNKQSSFSWHSGQAKEARIKLLGPENVHPTHPSWKYLKNKMTPRPSHFPWL